MSKNVEISLVVFPNDIFNNDIFNNDIFDSIVWDLFINFRYSFRIMVHNIVPNYIFGNVVRDGFY